MHSSPHTAAPLPPFLTIRKAGPIRRFLTTLIHLGRLITAGAIVLVTSALALEAGAFGMKLVGRDPIQHYIEINGALPMLILGTFMILATVHRMADYADGCLGASLHGHLLLKLHRLWNLFSGLLVLYLFFIPMAALALWTAWLVWDGMHLAFTIGDSLPLGVLLVLQIISLTAAYGCHREALRRFQSVCDHT
ncbi:MAG: hypothetical protein HQL50_15730 [Magnetococcales bacterium]|nr:hypothetical protein [Magnetococcales bacterium]